MNTLKVNLFGKLRIKNQNAKALLQNNYSFTVGHVSIKGFTLLVNKSANDEVPFPLIGVTVDRSNLSENVLGSQTSQIIPLTLTVIPARIPSLINQSSAGP